MKQVRLICAATLIVAALAVPALAGDVHSPVIADPPPAVEIQVSAASATSVNGSSDVTSVDAITALTVRLVEELLLIF